MKDLSDREIVKLIEAQGGRIVIGGKHFKLFSANGQLLGIMAKNGHSTKRERQNLLHQLKRADDPRVV